MGVGAPLWIVRCITWVLIAALGTLLCLSRRLPCFSLTCRPAIGTGSHRRPKPMHGALRTFLPILTMFERCKIVPWFAQKLSANISVGESYRISPWPIQPCARFKKSSSILVAIGWTDASGEVIAHSYDKTRHCRATTSPACRISLLSAITPVMRCL